MTGERWHAILSFCRILVLATAPDTAAAHLDQCTALPELPYVEPRDAQRPPRRRRHDGLEQGATSATTSS
jgi:hypothetical protein